jgi:hypothetical protein
MLLLKGLQGLRSLKPMVGLVLPKLKGLVATKGIALPSVSSSENVVYEDFAMDHVNRFLFKFDIILGNGSCEKLR